jgi:hypothetical protein
MMRTRLLIGLGLLPLALGCGVEQPTGTPNTSVTMLSAEPVRTLNQADTDLNDISGQIQYATFDVLTLPTDLDGDLAEDDAMTWLLIDLSSEPGCPAHGQFDAHYWFQKRSFNVAVEGAAQFEPGDVFQGGGGEFDGAGVTGSVTDNFGTLHFVMGDDSRHHYHVAGFIDKNDSLVEIDSIDEDSLSGRLSSTLLRQVLDNDQTAPVNISLFAAVNGAERCRYTNE